MIEPSCCHPLRKGVILSSFLLLLLLISHSIQLSSVYYISNTGFSGSQPAGITYNAGSLYIALNGTNQVVKFDLTSQQVSNIAGTGFGGQGGENEIATESPLRTPTIAKVASDGTIYIADNENNRIRKIVSGNVTTQASSISLSKPYGLDIHPVSGDLFITELTSRIVKLTPSSGVAEALTLNVTGYNGDQIPAISARVNNPLQIHVKSTGEYYFIDYGNSAIRKVDVNGNISTIVPGTFTAISGDPLVSDEFYFGGVGEVFKYSNGSAVRIAGGGPLDQNDVDASTVTFGAVYGIALGASGEIYFSEFGTGRVRKLVECSSGASYSPTTHTCVSCFGLSGAEACSGRGTCVGIDVCNCTTYGYSGSNCNVSSCNGIASNLASVCSGQGVCSSLNNCTCYTGYAAFDCSINTLPFALSTSISYTTVSDVSAIGVQAIYSDINPTYFIWACADCSYKNSNSQLSFYNGSNTLIVDGNLLNIGMYSFSVYAIFDNGPSYPARVSNTANFQVLVTKSLTDSSSLEIYGLPSTVVDTNSSTSLNIIIPSLTMGQGQINQFLSCGNSSSTCQLLISYSASISVIRNSANNIIASFNGFTVASTNFNGTVTFTPSLNFKDTNSYSGSTMTLSLVLNGATNLTFSSSVPILPSASPPTSTSANSTSSVLVDVLGTISPSSGSALSDFFTITFSSWTASAQLLPLTYSVGFLDPISSKVVRITEYSENSTATFILPYLASTVSNSRDVLATSSLSVVVFVNDSMGNQYSSVVASSVPVSPYTGTSSDLISLIGSYASSSLLTVFSYDSSLIATTNSTSPDVVLQIVNNVVIDPKHPTTALTALDEATVNADGIDSRVITALTTKINNFITTLNTNYKEEKSLYGFVKSKLSNADTTTTTEIISNILASGRGNSQSKGMADNLTGLLILGEIATLLTSQQSSNVELSKISFTSSQLDIAVSVFTMDKEMNGTANQVMLGGDNSVTMSLSEIMKQYNGFAKESATTMVTYDENIYTKTNTSVLTSTMTDFKYYQNQQVVTLENLSHNIELKFKITNSTTVIEKIMEYINSTQSNFNSTTNETSSSSLIMACKYWDEGSLAWSSRGCVLKGFNMTSQEILCSCSHTTMFTTFVEQNTTSIPVSVRYTIAAFYYGQIALGIFYFLSAIVILCLLIIFKNEQPISSRLITPYLGMIALIVEALLVYITQRGILVRQLTSTSSQMWESGDTDANTIANIVLIFANTINLTAILSYVMQVLRFEVMKYLYDLLASSRNNEKKSDRILTILRFLTSSSLFSAILIVFAVINVCYWVLWVVLRRTAVLEPAVYTYIVSISYTVVIFTFGVIITGTAIFDWVGSTAKAGIKAKRKSSLTREKFKIEEELQKEMEKLDIFEKIYNILVGIDEPLYFRTEMIIYVISFIFLILNQVIGLVGNNYRYGNEASYKKALIFDSISFIFEVLYVFTYLFVFGGYSLILLLISKVKTYRNNKQRKSKINEGREISEDMTLVFSNDEATELFSSFCIKEFSSENFYLYTDLKENTDIIEGKNISKLTPYLNYIHDTYVKDGANYQVNIPNKCRTSFMKLFNKYANDVLELFDNETVTTEVRSSFDILVQQIFVNLGDTFSRFVFTVEFKVFKKANQLQKEVFEEANVVLIDE